VQSQKGLGKSKNRDSLAPGPSSLKYL